MKKTILLIALIPLFFVSFAQNADKGDGKIKSNVRTNTREKMGDAKFINVSKIIYSAVTSGYKGKHLIAYVNDQLNAIIPAEEILIKGTSEMNVQIPIDKKDPNSELVDTVIRNEFNPDDFKGCNLLQDITKSDNPMKYSAEMIAISLNFSLNVTGIILPEQPMFWVKFSDLKTILDEKTYKELVEACIP
jgi:hypothetical protein